MITIIVNEYVNICKLHVCILTIHIWAGCFCPLTLKIKHIPQSTSDLPTDGPLNQQLLLFLIKHPPYFLVVLVVNGGFPG